VIETTGIKSSQALAELRERVLTNALIMASMAGPLISVLGAWQLFAQQELQWMQILRFSYTLLFPVLFLLRKRLSHHSLAVTFIALLLGMGFLVQTRGGLSMSSAAVQLMTLILSGLLFGTRGAVIALVVSLCGFILSGYMVLNGIVPTISQSIWDPSIPLVWVRNGIILTLFGGLSALAVTVTVKRLEMEADKLRDSLQREQHHRIALEIAEQNREAALKVIEDTRQVEALGRMASGIAHDFNNTLTVILTSAEMVQRDPYLSVRTRKYLSSIKNSAGQAADMIRHLLEMSRKGPGQITVMKAGEVLRGMANSIFRLLPADIEFAIDEVTDAQLEVDRTLLERALFNMVINARDALQERGKISVGCRQVNLMSDPAGIQEGKYVQFWVKDNGRGMSRETVANLFKPYALENLDDSSIGIGMTLVKGFAETAEGKVEIDSEMGVGTKVFLYLPAFEGSGTAIKKSGKKRGESRAATDTGFSLLVVEDDPDVLASTVATLALVGFAVDSAVDTDSALAKLKQDGDKYDLLCIDGVIPGAGSADVIAYLRDHHPRIKIVVCSGYIEEDLVLRGIRTGDLAFVRKPFLVDELLDTSKTQLDLPI
jgi:signal transduction histidine kinase/ActR/RegA family two-component response regulator